MSTRYIVRAPDRSNQGHDAVWTPGRRWPGGKEVEVEVLDQDECPTVTERISPDGDEKRTFPHPTQIGSKAWARISSDKQLTVRPVGDVPAEAVTLQAALADARAKLADATEKVTSNDARASLAEREVVKLGEALSEANAKIDELTERLNPPGTEGGLEGYVERLRAAHDASAAKIAELEEQLTAPPTADSASQTKGSGKGSTKRGG
jgi:hypothetical protein